jgi:hypothetical protein
MNVLSWEENREVRFGEGISRTSAEKSALYELQIWLPGQGAMRDLVRAESLQQAVEFAKNRYPNCRVDTPVPPARKPKLARSHTSPSVAAKARKKLSETRNDN